MSEAIQLVTALPFLLGKEGNPLSQDKGRYLNNEVVEKIRIQERSYYGITTNHKDIFAFVNLVNKVHHIPSYWLVIAGQAGAYHA